MVDSSSLVMTRNGAYIPQPVMTALAVMPSSSGTDSSAWIDLDQRLLALYQGSALDQGARHLATHVRLDLVEQLHRLDQADDRARPDLVPCLKVGAGRRATAPNTRRRSAARPRSACRAPGRPTGWPADPARASPPAPRSGGEGRGRHRPGQAHHQALRPRPPARPVRWPRRRASADRWRPGSGRRSGAPSCGRIRLESTEDERGVVTAEAEGVAHRRPFTSARRTWFGT